MTRTNLNRTVLALALSTALPLAQAETIFYEDFDSNVGWSGWTSSSLNEATSDNGSNAATAWKRNLTADTTVQQTLRVDTDTTAKTQAFSVSSRNFDIHNGSENINVSGYRSGQIVDTTNPIIQTTNMNMSGNMLGHVDQYHNGTNLPNTWEDNYFQIDGIKLDADMTSLRLTFDFDAALYSDGDGFAVAYSTDGVNFDILNPATSSAMQYTTLASGSTSGEGKSLNAMLGESTSGSAVVRGFNATQGYWSNTEYSYHLAGAAIFDLANTLAGQTLSLRFAYASNGTEGGSGYGINIDNIKVSGVCANSGSGVNCDLPPPPPNSGIPEPAPLGLALLGVTAVARRRLRRA